MKYKGILLDIDNTLYDYNTTNTFAKSKVLEFCEKEFCLSKAEIELAFNTARTKVNMELNETAASHNRLLYFQNMCERLGINPMKYGLEIYNVYWNNFIEILKPFDEIYLLLNKYKNKICLVTDLTANIQYRKIKKIELEKYCNKIVTSEETGREKPHPYIFMLALKKLELKAGEVCMIGDNYKKDIFGAESMGIKSIWFNHENKKENYKDTLIKEVKSFKEILALV